MDQIFFIFLFFCFLFLIETKAINLLICFVGIILTLAIKLANLNSLTILEGEYISYILILVQVSALTILFGFLIMLYPTLPIQKISPLIQNTKIQNTKNLNLKGTWPFGKYLKNPRSAFGILLFCLFFILLSYNYIKTSKEELFFPIGSKNGFFSILQAKEYITPDFCADYNAPFGSKRIIPQDTNFLRDLGYYLYTNDNNIFKLIILTIILLLAIIALFFLVAP